MQQPIAKPAPVAWDSTKGHDIGTIYLDAPPIFVHEPVLEEILQYSEHDKRRELGGFLAGGVYEDGRPYVEIKHFLPALDALSNAASLTFTHDTWSANRKEIEERFPGEEIVGWYHTHPDFGVFLSNYDLFIHRHFFSRPWQIAMVVDPVRTELGFFQWRGSEIVDCGFLCVRGPSANEQGRKKAGA